MKENKIYFVDVTNRDGVQTSRLGLAKLQKTIKNLRTDSKNKLEDINEARAHEYAEAQLEWDTYEQNFKNTVVSWDKAGSKAART